MAEKSTQLNINERETRRAVRRHADGTLSLMPGYDFQNPPASLSTFPEFLLKRLPSLKHLIPGGNA